MANIYNGPRGEFTMNINGKEVARFPFWSTDSIHKYVDDVIHNIQHDCESGHYEKVLDWMDEEDRTVWVVRYEFQPYQLEEEIDRDNRFSVTIFDIEFRHWLYEERMKNVDSYVDTALLLL